MSGSKAKLAALYGQLSVVYAELCKELGGTVQSTSGRVAPDRELDDPKFGDMVVKFDPRDWPGESYKGAHWSECSPEFLDCLAVMFDDFAANPKPGKEQYAKNDRANAERVRGWAKRLRSGWTAPPRNDAPPSGGFDGGSPPLGAPPPEAPPADGWDDQF